jgi:hypothetical protein
VFPPVFHREFPYPSPSSHEIIAFTRVYATNQTRAPCR